MLERIKRGASFILGLITLILGAILFSQRRKIDKVENELAHEKTTTEIKLNDQARKDAKENADHLVEDYEKSKR